jgi:hypothetical protein
MLRPLRGTGKSGWIGVTWDKRSGKWLASLRVNNRLKNLGQFESAEAAAQARAWALAVLVPGASKPTR